VAELSQGLELGASVGDQLLDRLLGFVFVLQKSSIRHFRSA
jgi:hypothetical protein